MRSLRGDWERGDKIRRLDVLVALVALVALVVLDVFFGGGIDFCEKMLYICREIDLLEF